MEFKLESIELAEKIQQIERDIRGNWMYLMDRTDVMQKQINEINQILKHLVK